jgi:hypothetical protein
MRLCEGPRAWVGRNATWLGLALAAFSFGAVVYRCLALHAPADPGYAVTWGLSAAVSRVAFDHPALYTTRTDVARELEKALLVHHNGRSPFGMGSVRNATAINAAIADVVKKVDRNNVTGTLLMHNDDKGIIDLVILCFRLLGYRVEYLTYAVLLLFFLSCAAFATAFFRSGLCLFLLVAFLSGVYLLIPFIVLNPQLQSLLVPRVFSMFSMVACLHCILFALRPSRRWLDVILCVGQALLICAVVHIRSSNLWQVAAVIAASGIAASGPLLRFALSLARRGLACERSQLWGGLGSLFPSLILGAGLLGLNDYRNKNYPAEYHRGDCVLTRPCWHNIYMGLAFSPFFAERDSLRVDDNSEFQAAGKYLINSGRGQEWQDMGGPLLTSGQTTTPGACPGAECPICITKYDKIAREIFLNHCFRHPWQMALAVGWYKPAALARNLGWMVGTRKIPPHLDLFNCGVVDDQYAEMVRLLDQGHYRVAPWHPVVLLPVLVAALLCGFRSAGDGRFAVGGAAILVCGSFVPPLLCCPTPHYIAEPFLGVAVAASLLILLVLSPLARRLGLLSKSPSQGLPAPESPPIE